MKLKFNISNIYFTLLIIYQLQGVLYEGGNTFAKGIIGFFVLFSLITAIYTNMHYKLPYYFKGLNLLLVMFTIYGTFHMFSTEYDCVYISNHNIPAYTYLLYIYISLLPIYVFYLGTIRNELSINKIQLWTIVLLFLAIAKFIATYINNVNYIGDDEITNNSGYLFVGLIPLLLFFNNRSVLQFILLAICMIFITLSMKRGAILIAGCCLIPFVISQWKNRSKSKRVTLSILIFAFFIGSIYFIVYMLQSSDYFVHRIEATKDGNSSYRDSLYLQLWNYFTNDASIWRQLFGGGANYTLQIAENYAHNDWLEILVNQGLFGIIIYVSYWLRFRQSIKLCSQIQELRTTRYILLICMLAGFMMTLFSMSYGSLPIGMTMAIGICLGLYTLYPCNNIRL